MVVDADGEVVLELPCELSKMLCPAVGATDDRADGAIDGTAETSSDVWRFARLLFGFLHWIMSTTSVKTKAETTNKTKPKMKH